MMMMWMMMMWMMMMMMMIYVGLHSTAMQSNN